MLLNKEQQLKILYRYFKFCDSIVVFSYIQNQKMVSKSIESLVFLDFFNQNFGWWSLSLTHIYLNNWLCFYLKEIEFIMFCYENYKNIFTKEEISNICSKFTMTCWTNVIREEFPNISEDKINRINKFFDFCEQLGISNFNRNLKL